MSQLDIRKFYSDQLDRGSNIKQYVPNNLEEIDKRIISSILLGDLRIILTVSLIGSLIAVVIVQEINNATDSFTIRVITILIIIFILYLVLVYMLKCKSRR